MPQSHEPPSIKVPLTSRDLIDLEVSLLATIRFNKRLLNNEPAMKDFLDAEIQRNQELHDKLRDHRQMLDML